jgi:glycosyltransferase involved in cell wall biosynthesis
MAAPLVSIVTPSFNQAAFLPATLRSVREQSYPAIEHLVMDGGSTDGTLDILRAATGIRWVSEPDRGQVHALNKGFAQTTGAIVAWLNSDDLLLPETVATAVRALEETGADLVYGDVDILEASGRVVRTSRGIPFDYRTLLYGINYIGQQSVFFRRTLLDRSGPLREEYDLLFDQELWLRMARHGQLVYCARLRGQIRVHPDAKSIARAARARAELQKLRAEYWARGGLPAWLQSPLCFPVVNGYYRLRRRIVTGTLPANRIISALP